jgi:serine/threonine-protein kinase HipA
MSSIRDLQHAVAVMKSDEDNEQVKKRLALLMVPDSSLRRARPKANVMDGNVDLWIAMFPSKGDTIDKAVWEFLAYRLALKAEMLLSLNVFQYLIDFFLCFVQFVFTKFQKKGYPFYFFGQFVNIQFIVFDAA